MKKTILLMMAIAICQADVMLEDGTKLRVKLEQNLTSANAKKGQEVELSAADDVRSGDTLIIAQGARVVGTIVDANPKRRMGRSGSLDFSIDKVRAIDGRYISLRNDRTKEKGRNSYVKTGVIVASIAVFVPVAAPVALLMKGKDIEVEKGRVFEVFTDVRYTMKGNGKSNETALNSATPQEREFASVVVNSPHAGAEIAVDGKYMGSAPATFRLAPGTHEFEVVGRGQIWKRTMDVSGGSSFTLNATFEPLLDASRR